MYRSVNLGKTKIIHKKKKKNDKKERKMLCVRPIALISSKEWNEYLEHIEHYLIWQLCKLRAIHFEFLVQFSLINSYANNYMSYRMFHILLT